MMDAELDAIFSVLAPHYASEPVQSKPRGKTTTKRPEAEREFFKQKFDLSDEEVEMIRSEIDEATSLNEKFDRLEEVLELLGFEKANHHRDRGLSEFREDGDYGLTI